MPDYNEALKRPFTDIKKLIIGLIISIIPIINLIASGYQLKCAGSVIKKKKKMYVLPEWTNWSNLFLIGIVSFFISVIYLIPAFIVAFLTVGRTLFLDISSLNYNDFGFPVIIVVILALLAVYLLPMALTRYSFKEKFKDAFQFKDIFRRAFSWKYFATWLFSAVILIVLILVLGWIRIPVGGFQIDLGTSFANFIGLVISFTLFGRLYGEVK